jgi:hypothetical protein
VKLALPALAVRNYTRVRSPNVMINPCFITQKLNPISLAVGNEGPDEVHRAESSLQYDFGHKTTGAAGSLLTEPASGYGYRLLRPLRAVL